MRRSVKQILENWDTVLVINGYTDGLGYGDGNNVIKTCDDPTNGATKMLVVNSCYNV